MSIPEGSSSASNDFPIPVIPIDVSKLYDIYSTRVGEDRLYEGVKIVSIRTFARQRENAGVVIGGYIEIEAQNASRMLIPQNHIDMLCEHGTQPIYKVIGSWGGRSKQTPAA